MKTSLLSLLMLSCISLSSFANTSCDFQSESGDFIAQSDLQEEESSDHKYKVISAKAEINGSMWSNIVLVKNLDGSIPLSGTVNFPKVVAANGWWTPAYSVNFTQEIKNDKIIYHRVFSDYPDTFTSENKLNANNSVESIKIKEILKESWNGTPIFVKVGSNKLNCIF